jgi:hypothetical protein
MIKTLTAYTMEIDDVEAASAEILKQLDLEKNLLKNSFGILTCFADYIDSGAVEAVCKKLPFEVIGGTVLANECSGEIGQMMLSVMVLTSDDIKFSCALSGEIDQQDISSLDREIAAAYNKASSAFGEKPSLLFTFTPLFFNIAGDFIVDAFDKASGGTPLFGTLASDHTVGYEKVRSIYNGKAYDKRIAVAAFFGEVNPDFYIASVSYDKVLKQRAFITKSKGNILIEVNGVPAGEYMRSIGLSPENLTNYNAVPFMVTFKDSAEPTARGIFHLTEDGNYVCGGIMPEGAVLSVGTISHDEVLSTTQKLLSGHDKEEKYGGMLTFSCIARNMILGMDSEAEMGVVKKMLPKIPHTCNYSSGEICPVYDKNGKLQNRFHNYTFVACKF